MSFNYALNQLDKQINIARNRLSNELSIYNLNIYDINWTKIICNYDTEFFFADEIKEEILYTENLGYFYSEENNEKVYFANGHIYNEMNIGTVIIPLYTIRKNWKTPLALVFSGNNTEYNYQDEFNSNTELELSDGRWFYISFFNFLDQSKDQYREIYYQASFNRIKNSKNKSYFVAALAYLNGDIWISNEVKISRNEEMNL